MRDAGKFLRTALLIAVAVATLITARAAWAADRWVVVWGEGPDSDAIAKEVKAQLPSGLTAVDPKQFRDALAKQGHKGPMGKALDSAKTRDKLFERVRKAAEAAKLDAVVIVRTQKGKKGRTAQVYVVDPKSAALAREDEVKLPPKKGKDDPKAVVASVAPALEKFAPAPEAPPPAEPEKAAAKDEAKPEGDEAKEDKKEEKKEEPGAKRPTGEVSRALFVVGAGIELGLRRFEYNDPHPLSRNLRAYNVAGAPMLGVHLELYPLADMGGPLGDIGLAGGYSRALALQSAPQGGEKIQTTWDRWTVGLRYRIRVAGDAGPVIYVGGAYGNEQFTFSGADERLAAEVPQAKYRFVRAGADARIPVGPIAIMAGASYLFTSAEDADRSTVAGRFPNASVGGVEGNLGLGVGIVKGLEARVLARYTRFFYSMNPEPDALVRDTRGVPYVAGGAVDHLGSLHIGVAYAY